MFDVYFGPLSCPTDVLLNPLSSTLISARFNRTHSSVYIHRTQTAGLGEKAGRFPHARMQPVNAQLEFLLTCRFVYSGTEY